jgi:hypothetical protein
VTCLSATDCWAVGFNIGSNGRALIEHYTGSNWAIVSSPNTPGDLNGVTCVSAGDCWAVGINTIGNGQPLIERKAGSSWATVRGRSSSA